MKAPLRSLWVSSSELVRASINQNDATLRTLVQGLVKDIIDSMTRALGLTAKIGVFVNGDFTSKETVTLDMRTAVQNAATAFQMIQTRANNGSTDIGNLHANVCS